MRAALALFAVLASSLLAESFADTASADAPNLDLHISAKLAVANYQLTPTTLLTVGADEFAPHAGEPKHYFAFVIIEDLPRCIPDCLLPSQRLLQASAIFNSPQLHGGVNGAKLDVTLPVVYCVLSSCPTSIEVSLAWKPDGQPLRDTNSAHTDTESCQFTRVTRFAVTTSTVTGFVSDGTTKLASGETSGTVQEGSSRIVGFGDPAVCF